MSEPLSHSTYLDFFKSIIRYLASGFVAIFVLKLLGRDVQQWAVPKDETNWVMLIIAGILGITIYAVHAAFLDSVFNRLSLWVVFLKRKKMENYLPEEFKENKVPLKEIMFQLDSERYQREGKTDTNLPNVSIQKRLEHQLAFLVFLYTSSYTLILIPIINGIKFSFSERSIFLLIAGIILMGCGFLLDLKITTRELWLMRKEKTEAKPHQ